MELAKLKADVAFEMVTALRAPYFCFHDADVHPEGDSFAENTRNLEEITDYFAGKMQETGRRKLRAEHQPQARARPNGPLPEHGCRV